jgi:hypothetical protein
VFVIDGDARIGIWSRTRQGHFDIAVGAASIAFAPLPDPPRAHGPSPAGFVVVQLPDAADMLASLNGKPHGIRSAGQSLPAALPREIS